MAFGRLFRRVVAGRVSRGKVALAGRQRRAAITYGPENIRVNAIAPGTTLTEMIQEWESATPGVIERLVADNPLRRAADPAEIAEAAAWLLSERASYVTGAILRVNRGDVGRVGIGSRAPVLYFSHRRHQATHNERKNP